MDQIRVGDEYRTNRLSLQPGGCEVKIYLSDGKILIYDKVKKPYYYIRTMDQKKEDGLEIVRIDIDDLMVWGRMVHTEDMYTTLRKKLL